MYKEIKNTNWLQFCKQFNRDNQYRHAEASIEHNPVGSIETIESSMFLGFLISREGNWINKITLILRGKKPDDIAKPVASVCQPVTLSVTKDDTGVDRHLEIMGEDGTKISLMLEGEQNPQLHHSLMDELAPSVFERAGRSWMQYRGSVENRAISYRRRT